jgi:hypothetical protein
VPDQNFSRKFVATPGIPDQLTDWQNSLFHSLKENVELLTGTRGEAGAVSTSIIRGDITVSQVGQQDLSEISARSNGVTISGSDVALLDNFRDLLNDVQLLANDVYATRRALDLLIRNLTGEN